MPIYKKEDSLAYILAKHLHENSQSFMENTIERGTISNEAEWESHIENISPDTNEENDNWEAWYIRGIESVINIIKSRGLIF